MIYLGIALGIFIAECLIKSHIEKRWEAGKRKSIFGGKMLLQKYHNKGAFLNFGEKRSGLVAGVSVMLTTFALAALLLTLGQKENRALKIGLSLLLGGAFSNTYDRLKRKYVVDYMSFDVGWKPLSKVVFNVADFFIMAGALICSLSLSK